MSYGAQNLGPITAPQVNQDFLVGSVLYPTIQSAVTAAAAITGGARVIVPPSATPSDTIANASGTASVVILDQRPGLTTTYNWTGTAYAVQNPTSLTTTGALTAASGTFSGPVTLPSTTPTGYQAVSYTYLQSQLQNAGMLPNSTAIGQFLVSTSASGNTYTARGIQATDLPATITSNTTGSAATLSQTLAISSGGTGATTAAGALLSLGALSATGGAISGTYTGAPTFSGALVFSGNPTFSGTANFTGASPITYNGSALVGLATIASSATPVFNGAGGNVFVYTLAQNVTSSTTSNLIPGQFYTFEIIQAASGTGPFTFTPPATANGFEQPSANPSAKTVQVFFCSTGGNLYAIGPAVYE